MLVILLTRWSIVPSWLRTYVRDLGRRGLDSSSAGWPWGEPGPWTSSNLYLLTCKTGQWQHPLSCGWWEDAVTSRRRARPRVWCMTSPDSWGAAVVTGKQTGAPGGCSWLSSPPVPRPGPVSLPSRKGWGGPNEQSHGTATMRWSNFHTPMHLEFSGIQFGAQTAEGSPAKGAEDDWQRALGRRMKRPRWGMGGGTWRHLGGGSVSLPESQTVSGCRVWILFPPLTSCHFVTTQCFRL